MCTMPCLRDIGWLVCCIPFAGHWCGVTLCLQTGVGGGFMSGVGLAWGFGCRAASCLLGAVTAEHTSDW
jgi:hypothetical protein